MLKLLQSHTFFFFGRERYSLHKCNDSDLKSMWCPPQAKKAKANNTSWMVQAWILSIVAMKAKQATVKPKPVSQLEKHACFLSTYKAWHKVGSAKQSQKEASIVKAKPTLSYKQTCYEALLLTQQLQSNQVKQQCCKRSLMQWAKARNAIKHQTSKFQCFVIALIQMLL